MLLDFKRRLPCELPEHSLEPNRKNPESHGAHAEQQQKQPWVRWTDEANRIWGRAPEAQWQIVGPAGSTLPQPGKHLEHLVTTSWTAAAATNVCLSRSSSCRCYHSHSVVSCFPTLYSGNYSCKKVVISGSQKQLYGPIHFKKLSIKSFFGDLQCSFCGIQASRKSYR